MRGGGGLGPRRSRRHGRACPASIHEGRSLRSRTVTGRRAARGSDDGEVRHGPRYGAERRRPALSESRLAGPGRAGP